MKTNLAGFAVLVLLGLYFFNLITTEHFVTSTAFLVTIGFFAAKDGVSSIQSILGTRPPVDKDEK